MSVRPRRSRVCRSSQAATWSHNTSGTIAERKVEYLEASSSLILYETFIRAGPLRCGFGICGGAHIESPRVLYLVRQRWLLLPAILRLRELLWTRIWLPPRLLRKRVRL